MIPNLPTDNLYKFLSLSGLVIVIFFTYIARISIQDLERKSIDVAGREIMQAVSSKRSKNNSDKKGVNEESKGETNYVSKVGPVTINCSLQNQYSDTHPETVKISIDKIKVMSMQKYTDKLVYFSYFFIIAGMVMSYIGFTYWYKKVQKPLDAILVNDLARSNSESKAREHPKPKKK